MHEVLRLNLPSPLIAKKNMIIRNSSHFIDVEKAKYRKFEIEEIGEQCFPVHVLLFVVHSLPGGNVRKFVK